MNKFIENCVLVNKDLLSNSFKVLKNSDDGQIEIDTSLYMETNKDIYEEKLKKGDGINLVMGITIDLKNNEKETLIEAEAKFHLFFKLGSKIEITEEFYQKNAKFFISCCFDDIRNTLQKQFDMSSYAGFILPYDPRLMLADELQG